MAISDQLPAAYQTAKALAAGLSTLAGSLPLDAADGLKVRRSTYLISAILAPRIRSAADVATIGQAIVDAASVVGAGATPSDAAAAFYVAAASAAIAAPAFRSPALSLSGRFGRALAACAEAAFLGQAFVAEAKSEFVDRQSAIAARGRIATAMDGATDRIAQGGGQDVFGLLSQVALTCSSHVATVAADLRPVVGVETLRSAPSTALAWGLYGDPSRAPELVARNRVATPLFMPTKIQALAPKA